MKRFSSLSTIVSITAMLAVMATTSFGAIPMDMVTVGNPGNAADTTGVPDPSGAVGYVYDIGKCEVTNGQYAAFLTDVVGAGTDTYGLYNASMPISYAAGVYTATAGNVNKPVDQISFYDGVRFANWMTSGATETGSYTITNGGADAGDVVIPDAVQRAAWAAGTSVHYLLPSSDEWYKAAYHDSSAGTAGTYFDYPTGSDTVPADEAPAGTDLINGSANYSAVAGGLTDVGAYTAKPSDSTYGTFDQGGNVWERTDTFYPTTTNPMVRGGGASTGTHWGFGGADWMLPTHPSHTQPDFHDGLGFRVSSVGVVPEPSTLVLLGLGLLGLLAYAWRKRK